MIRKLTAIAAVAAAFVAAAPAALGQDYPSRLIKIIQGFPPGGNVDLIARILATEMEKSLGQSIVVEAKPGLAGALAAETAARADADGYTLLVLPSAHPAYGALAKNVKFKVVDDFSWISVASFYPFIICVKADSRFKTLKQLVDEAKAKPGELKYGSAGIGSILHTTVELIGSQTKTKFLHVPYRGEAPALTGVLTGDVDFIAATTGPVSARLKSGEFRALAVTGKTRWPDFPDVPTVAETVLPGFEVISWTGMAAPANLPKPIVDRLNGEVRKALAVPDVKQKLTAMGGDPRATTPDEMKALVSRQYETWKKLAAEANLSIN
ncbi:MAG: tripartite tricarboxylate transporter substrate binding protein [Xanthobacteraceae bacterium]|nr:tripartite tricarboxylate transporter substrate binding protein [Xanthobacteraceae bacterium]